ncbi:MAG: response regulator [Pseudomonadota bacterium]
MSKPERPNCSGRLVLVEDDPDVRRSLTLMLRARGFSMDQYASGTELLSTRVLPIADGLLIDYKLPGINGIELLGRLRKAGQMAPALMITGFISTTLHARAAEAGFLDVIEKPSTGQVLVQRIFDIMA